MSSTSRDNHAEPSRNVLVIEDEPVFQRVLRDATLVAGQHWTPLVFSCGHDALAHVRSHAPRVDLALVDLGLPDVSGIEVMRQLRALLPDAAILVVTVIASEEKVLESLESGATGYILKDDDAIDIATAIRHVLKGNLPISPALARCLLRFIPKRVSPIGINPHGADISLTRRETTLLRHIAAGMSYIEAGHAMQLQLSTVHSYSRTLFRKLGARSKTQAIAYARSAGLVH